MTAIQKIEAREILDSRGNPTIEATVYTVNFKATASVPAGASTGVHEAKELRDGGPRYLGLGVSKSVKIIQQKISPQLKGVEVTDQGKIDNLMLKLDGHDDKSKLGANSILAVSLACARAGANSQKIQLFKYLNNYLTQISGSSRPIKLPRMYFNIINGGAHADNKLSFQEFLISPNLNSASKNIQAASEIYHTLKKIMQKKGLTTNLGDEGGFAPVKLKKTTEVLDLLVKAVKEAGYGNKCSLALDAAASQFYHRGKYLIDGRRLSSSELLGYYLSLVRKYPLSSIEDPFQQEDFAMFAQLKKKSGIQIVGDDLTVTNQERIQAAIYEDSCNCLLLKVNQIGTLTEALSAADLAFKNGWQVMVSHRSGETEDTFIADLAVALGCGMIKAGAPCRGERTAKYNRLLKIENDLI